MDAEDPGFSFVDEDAGFGADGPEAFETAEIMLQFHRGCPSRATTPNVSGGRRFLPLGEKLGPQLGDVAECGAEQHRDNGDQGRVCEIGGDDVRAGGFAGPDQDAKPKTIAGGKLKIGQAETPIMSDVPSPTLMAATIG
jgi:hypothetical protein